ncbi:MAG: NUDIX domain-containing protein [Verrucomicrobia bacterium]|nr:NUDIX domain-containing protein [Verrucomicrobiota bacterium]
MPLIVHEKRPPDFIPHVEVAACYLEVGDKVLLLQLAPGKSEEGLWGVPAGKMEMGETPLQTAIRELYEETGITLDIPFRSLGTLYMQKPHIHYAYHLFYVQLPSPLEIRLSLEHQNFLWASREDLKTLPLMVGAEPALTLVRQRTMRQMAHVNAHLILEKEGQVLLMLRQNTGFYDGEYGLVSGHVESGEGATEGMIREAKEEIGIDLSLDDLKVVHISHNQSDRQNVDIFFHATRWKGEIHNQEPHKCKELRFFPLDQLPEKTIQKVQTSLKAISQGQFYSEFGF